MAVLSWAANLQEGGVGGGRGEAVEHTPLHLGPWAQMPAILASITPQASPRPLLGVPTFQMALRC